MIDTLFYLIWRDRYLRKHIRNQRFRNKRINLSTSIFSNDGNSQHQYLSTIFTNSDKLIYNIDLHLDILDYNIELYKNNRYKELFNSLYCGNGIDFSVLPQQGIHKISFIIDYGFKVDKLVLPDSLVELAFYYSGSISLGLFKQHVDSFIYNLSTTNIKKLLIPSEYKFTKQCILPDTLEQFDYYSSRDSLDYLVVAVTPSNKVFNNCSMIVESIHDLEWVRYKTWIPNLHSGNALQSIL